MLTVSTTTTYDEGHLLNSTDDSYRDAEAAAGQGCHRG
jgi:hypothetical protein